MSENEHKEQGKIAMPSLERIQQELGSAKSLDDFFGKGGIFARLFATTSEQMLDAELTAQLGYEKYEAKGRNSGNSRNGKYKRRVRSSGGEVEVAVPRDRAGEYAPRLLKKYETSSPASKALPGAFRNPGQDFRWLSAQSALLILPQCVVDRPWLAGERSTCVSPTHDAI
jgi:hypothetical protein